MPVGEFLTENCVLMLRKIPYTPLYSPTVGEPSSSVGRANPGATAETTSLELMI